MILTFKTTTAAMAMEKKCGEDKIPGRLIPLPGEISAGCGLSWRILPEEYIEHGNVEVLRKETGLDVETMTAKIRKLYETL